MVGHLSPPKFGSMRIQLRFETPLPGRVSALVYAEFDNEIRIDGFGNAVTNYM